MFYFFSYATVLYDFESRFADEMNVKAGWALRILRAGDDWAEVYNPENNERGLYQEDFLNRQNMQFSRFGAALLYASVLRRGR